MMTTIEDFWRIFLEHETNKMIQLHTIEDDEGFVYYPETIQMTMMVGSICSITLIEEEFLDDRFMFRRFLLVNHRDHQRKMIDHFECLLPLMNNDSPESEESQVVIETFHLLDFLRQIEERCEENSPMPLAIIHGG